MALCDEPCPTGTGSVVLGIDGDTTWGDSVVGDTWAAATSCEG